MLALGASPANAVQSDVGDPDVVDAIERELFLDAAVPSNRIDTRVEAGIVTLTGTTRSLLAKERAARIAEAVKGVRSVINRITVLESGKTDDEIRTDVDAALLGDPAADSYEVDVSVDRGHATLTGTVDSWQERRITENVAKGVHGVLGVTNEIQVSYDDDRRDDEIRHEIEATLRWNALVDHGLVRVTVDGGEVKLSGTVGSASEKREARLDAYVPGVKSVDDSDLEVARWARDDDLRESKYVPRPDDEVRDAVTTALIHDPRVYSFDVHASAASGTVTLRGVVDNLKAKRAAEDTARNTVGVISVHNHLKVRPVTERTSSAIAGDVRAALRRDPFIERDEITVRVDDGTVHLTGTVDSAFDRAIADDVASRVDGVTHVVNGLTTDDRTFTYDPWVDTFAMYSYPWYGAANAYESTWKTDQQIRAEIQNELFWSPFVDADEVNVTVVDGVATLTGVVDSWMEVGAARDNALEGGAKRVRNRLELEGASTGGSSSTQ